MSLLCLFSPKAIKTKLWPKQKATKKPKDESPKVEKPPKPPTSTTSAVAARSAPPQLSEAERLRLTPFERVVYDMAHNEKMVNDLILGRRVGFYELRGEIGQGNFSSVRLGIHALTKGLLFYLRYLFILPISLCLYICILFYD